MIIGKHFEFEASHQLPNEEIYGKCRNLHGHTYKLKVEIKGTLNKKGWVIDFKKLKEVVNKVVIDKYDHSHLNNFFNVPTAENILIKISKDLTKELLSFNGIVLHSLTLYETSNSYAKIEN